MNWKKTSEDAVKIVIAGDLFPTSSNFHLFAGGDADAIFGDKILSIFQESDYAVCNLEGVFTDELTKPKVKDGPNIRAPKDCINAIKALGVNCVSLANNHATDYGLKGLQDSLQTLEKYQIGCFGAGEDKKHIKTHYRINLKDREIVFYGVSETVENIPTDHEPGVNLYDEYRVCNEIRDLKKHCDFLIVLYHGGIENLHFNTESIRTRFHRMADCGADMIISQHTHAIGEEEYYKNSYLLYGQGNFCFHFSKNLDEWVKTGLLLEVDLRDNKFSVCKHIVNRELTGISYDHNQDFSGFDNRSKRLNDGDVFQKEFMEYADKKITVYLNAFRGKNMIDKILRHLVTKEKYCRYIRKRFSERNLLKILLALQCEEFREVAIQGLQNMLGEVAKENEGKLANKKHDI